MPEKTNYVFDAEWHYKFREVEEVKAIFESINNIAGNEAAVESTFDRFVYIIDFYQELPHLLDPHLESMLSQLLGYVRDKESPDAVIHLSFKFLYLLTKARGHKVIVRMLPHEVTDVEPVLSLLSRQSIEDYKTWETRYMLLLWLSIVCMIPFDMVRLDNTLAQMNGAETKEPIMDRIINFGKMYMVVNDKARDGAAFMLSRFMTRHDVKKEKLPEFLDWALQVMHKADKQTSQGISSICGVMSVLSQLFKQGKREDLVEYAPVVLKEMLSIDLRTSNNTIMRKLGIKQIQRLGLTFLKARVAAWRYNRGQRSLADSLAPQNIPTQNETADMTQEDEDEEYDIPEEIETVIEELLNGLKDQDTIVRWSAAKGIGRLTGRLPMELADEVVGSLLELFTIAETDGAWHGGCLALAELGRRGLLVPERLDTVVPIIIKALSYDEKRGNFSVGAHVRDAACYVCWSFARAYDPTHIEKHVTQIANALVKVFIFDREVSVRRAASAAFQENVGRQGNFPHGIDIVTTCDYFAVGNRTHCYHDLSVYVAQFPEYTLSLIEHLADVKVGHWDIAMRELTAQGLYNLTSKAPEFVAQTIMPRLLEKSLSMEVNVRHGAILAVANTAAALFTHNKDKNIAEIIGEKSLLAIQDICKQIQDAKLFRGIGGELMRKAVCVLIEKASLACLPFHGQPVIELWQGVIDDCLEHVEPEVQDAAVKAIPAFFSQYYKQPDGTAQAQMQEKIIEKYMKQLNNSLETTRVGFIHALGVLPAFFWKGWLERGLKSLINATEVTDAPQKWADARQEAVRALTNICTTVGVSELGADCDVINPHNINLICSAYFKAMRDYTLDSRGDVGAGIREASLSGLEMLTILMMSLNAELVTPDISRQIFCHLVQQASEKIDRTRAHAGEIFKRMLYHDPEIPHVPHREDLLNIFDKEEIKYLNWAVPRNSFPRYTKLLSLPTYAYSVLLGLTVSVGGLTESLVRFSALSLMDYMRAIGKDRTAMEGFSEVLLKVFKDHQKDSRVTLPMFKMLDQLLSNDCFSIFTEDSGESSFSFRLYKISQEEISKCADPQKLLASIEVFTGLLQFPSDVRKKAMQQLTIFMCHRYPIVRKASSYKLYEAIMTYEDIVSEENMDEIMTILSDTLWDRPIPEIRPIRNNLCDLLGVPKPVVKVKK